MAHGPRALVHGEEVLTTHDLPPAVTGWIERALGPGAKVMRATGLPASATAKHLVEITLADGSTQKVILRRYHDAQRRAKDPWYVPAHEALALELLAGTDVPAPHLYAADLEGAICGMPALLESWLPGGAPWRPRDLDSYLTRAAETLVAIHRVRLPHGTKLPRYAPYHDVASLAAPSFTTRPGLWERVARALSTSWPPYAEIFIHRDYHPGNVLWDGGRVTAVVDWATAAIGPAGIDLARMRQNLASHLGVEVAERFARAYAAAGGDPAARHPFWDLLDAADTMADLRSPVGPGGGDFARFEAYVERVFAEL